MKKKFSARFCLLGTVCLLWLSPLLLFAQSTSLPRLSAGVFLAPEWTLTRQSGGGNSTPSSIKYDGESWNGASAGVFGRWMFWKNIGVRLGAGASRRGHTVIATGLVFPSDIIAGNFDGSTMRLYENYTTLDIPLALEWHLLERIYLSAGTAQEILLKGEKWSKINYSTGEIESGTKKKLDTSQGRFYSTALLGIGGHIFKRKKWGLNAALVYRADLRRQQPNAAMDGHFYKYSSLGLRLELSFSKAQKSDNE